MLWIKNINNSLSGSREKDLKEVTIASVWVERKDFQNIQFQIITEQNYFTREK